MEFETWLAIGREHGFCSIPTCSTHDLLPHTPEEEKMWELETDPCIFVLRLYEDERQMRAAENGN